VPGFLIYVPSWVAFFFGFMIWAEMQGGFAGTFSSVFGRKSVFKTYPSFLGVGPSCSNRLRGGRLRRACKVNYLREGQGVSISATCIGGKISCDKGSAGPTNQGAEVSARKKNGGFRKQVGR